MNKLINKSSLFPFVLLGIWALLRISFYESTYKKCLREE